MDLSRGNYWLGHPGTLFPVHDVAGGIAITDADEPALSTSLGGGIRARVPRNRGSRSWKIDIPDARVDELVALRELTTSSLGPFVMVDPWAQVSNVLTPEQSVMQSSSPALAHGGGWPIASESGGGFTTTSRANPAAQGGQEGIVRVGPAPIPPWWAQRKVTVSVLLATSRAGGAYVVLDWLGASGSQVGGGVVGSSVKGMDALRRSTVTASPPPGAVACRVACLYAEVIARPQVTWTDAPVEWDVGNGAMKVLIHSLSRSIQYAVPDDAGLRRQDASFTVTEIGPVA